LKENESLDFVYSGEPRIVANLRPPSSQDRLRTRPDVSVRLLVAEAIIELDVPPDLRESYAKVEASHEGEEARVQRQQLEPFERKVFGELTDRLRSTVSVFRWVMGYVEDPVDPLTFLGYAYSHDGLDWNDVVPRIGSLIVSFSYGVPFSLKGRPTICSDVVELVSKKMEEPLGHQLFREAWSLKKVSLRSALVIGFAAGEVGFMQFLEHRHLKPVPDRASWYDLVKRRLSDKRVPRPMLGNKLVRPPERFLRSLKRCAELRNQVVHDGSVRLDRVEVEGLLKAIDEFLWALDAYSRHGWAIQHVLRWQDWLE